MSGFSISFVISLILMPSNSAAKVRINDDFHNRLKVEFFYIDILICLDVFLLIVFKISSFHINFIYLLRIKKGIKD